MRMRKISFLAVLSFAMLMTAFILPSAVFADEGVAYTDRSWDESQFKVIEETKTEYGCKAVTSSTSTLTEGWWVVSGVIANNNRIEVKGNVRLILKDVAKLSCNGIRVPESAVFSIYGQENDSGILEAVSSKDERAGIGGDFDENSGTINIYGGNVTAQADDDSYYASGLGAAADNNGSGCDVGNAGKISIYGGKVTAKGSNGSAAIGASHEGGVHAITIYGGDVTAKGDTQGAGIGRGWHASTRDIVHCNDEGITIKGGTVTAEGGKSSAGIGGGPGNYGIDTYIQGGTVTAIAGSDWRVAIGVGKSRYADDEIMNHKVEVYERAKVTSGTSETKASPVNAANRSAACRNGWVRIELCDHPDAAKTITNETHNINCRNCGIKTGIKEHIFTEADNVLVCKDCRYEAANITFNAGDGSGTSEVIRTKNHALYKLPDPVKDLGFDAPEGESFLGWQCDGSGEKLPAGTLCEADGHIAFMAHWAETYGVTVAGTPVTSENKDNVLGDGKVAYDPETGTLDFDDEDLTVGQSDSAILTTKDNTLTITGKLHAVKTSGSGGVIKAERGSIVLNGDIYVEGLFCILSEKYISIEGGTVEALGSGANSRGIDAAKGVFISNGIEYVHATGENMNRGAVFADNNDGGRIVLDSALGIVTPSNGSISIGKIVADTGGGSTEVAKEVLIRKVDCTVTFAGGEGDAAGSMEPATVQKGSDYNLPDCGFTQNGKVFTVWKAGGKTYQPGDAVTIDEDTVFTAQWHDAKCTIKFNLKGASGSMEDMTVDYDSWVEIPGPPKGTEPPDGKCYFSRWLESSGSGVYNGNLAWYAGQNIHIMGDAYLTASWPEHDMKEIAEVPATCTEAGMARHWACDNCGDLFEDEAGSKAVSAESLLIAALGHQWNEWYEKVPPTEEAGGIVAHDCVVCGESEEMTVPPSVHQHDQEPEFVEKVAPGCETSGTEAHYQCTGCGNLFWDKACENLASPGSLRIPALGHKPGTPERGTVIPATFDSDGGYSLTTKCGRENCGKVLKVERVIIPAVSITKLAKTSYTYTGKPFKPAVTVADSDAALSEDNYSITYAGNVNAGTAKVAVILMGELYDGTKELYFKINKAANPLKIKAKTATVKYSKLKKKTQKLSVTKVIKFTKKGKGKMSYGLVSAKKGSKSFKKYFKVSKTDGKVTIKKNKKMKKGTYKVKIKVKAAGDSNYKASAWKTVTATVKVK